MKVRGERTPEGITRTFEEWQELATAKGREVALSRSWFEQRQAWQKADEANKALIVELRAELEEAATRIAELEETIRIMAGQDCVIVPADIDPEEARHWGGRVWPPAPGALREWTNGTSPAKIGALNKAEE